MSCVILTYRSFPGESTFQRCKLSLIYSVVFYVAMNIYAYYVSRERIRYIRYSEASFDDLMYSVIHFLYVIPHFYLIPCHWKEVTKVGSYFAHWSEFQVRLKQYLIISVCIDNIYNISEKYSISICI
jgi:hypothetical protein